MTHTSQSGFATIIAIALVLLIGAASTVAYIKVKSTQDEKAANTARIASDEARKKVENAAKNNDAKITSVADQPATPTPQNPPTTTPQQPAVNPQPTPQQPTSNATTFTNQHCPYANITAYVSNPNGAAVSSNAPDQWQTTKTYPYKSTISGRCDTWNRTYEAYVNIGGVFVNKSDISPTAP